MKKIIVLMKNNYFKIEANLANFSSSMPLTALTMNFNEKME